MSKLTATSQKFIDYVVGHYERCLSKYGDTHRGVDWPSAKDAEKRYLTMLEMIPFQDANYKSSAYSLLDFGCGAAHLLDFIQAHAEWRNLKYLGLDISPKFIELCKSKYPDIPFYAGDILIDQKVAPSADFIILNGVFTEKRELSFDEQWLYMKAVLKKVFCQANKGIAFNVMSKAVEWERDDLFHLPVDLLTKFLCTSLSRHYVIRNDYGLYEYTVYVFRESRY